MPACLNGVIVTVLFSFKIFDEYLLECFRRARDMVLAALFLRVLLLVSRAVNGLPEPTNLVGRTALQLSGLGVKVTFVRGRTIFVRLNCFDFVARF